LARSEHRRLAHIRFPNQDGDITDADRPHSFPGLQDAEELDLHTSTGNISRSVCDAQDRSTTLYGHPDTDPKLRTLDNSFRYSEYLTRFLFLGKPTHSVGPSTYIWKDILAVELSVRLSDKVVGRLPCLGNLQTQTQYASLLAEGFCSVLQMFMMIEGALKGLYRWQITESTGFASAQEPERRSLVECQRLPPPPPPPPPPYQTRRLMFPPPPPGGVPPGYGQWALI